MAETPNDSRAEDTSQDVSPSGLQALLAMLSRARIGLFLGGVVLAECLLAYILLPSTSDVQALAESRLAAQPDELFDVADEPRAYEENTQPVQEVDLGKFTITAYQPVENTTLRIDFHLFATVLEEDQSEFEQRMASSKNRFREQVIVTVRSGEVSDLTDAGLGLIKRKILEKTNRTLGKPLLQSVIFSEFSFIEQ